MLNMNAVAASIVVGQQDDTVFICSLFPMHKSSRIIWRRSGFSQKEIAEQNNLYLSKKFAIFVAHISECKQ